MAQIDFTCPHCGQELNGSDDMAGQVVDCPVCNKSFQIPGGLIETEIQRPPYPPPSTNDDKGKTIRIELPPEFLAEPEKHIFKIKRIQH